MKRLLTPLLASIAVVGCFTSVWGQVLNDPLNGSTTGTRAGGAFVTGGWQVTNQYDAIYWHIGAYSKGAFEYNVSGLPGSSCPGGSGFKNELSVMYDYTFSNSDNQYSPGYLNNPYKEFLRKQCDPGKEGEIENLWLVPGGFLEDDTEPLSWDSASNYKFRIEWENVGGNAIKRTYRSGALIWLQTLPGSWSPVGQSVRIASSTRRADEGASVGAVYSNVKAYDLNTYVPPAPAVSVPANGATVKNQVTYIQWTDVLHTLYQVRVNTSNDPNTGIAWDSQQVTSDRNFSWTGALFNGTYYAFVRLGTSAGWGNWSANGYTFTVNTSFVPSGTDFVTVKGNSYANFGGPFLGLGFSYMRSLYNCKYQRARYESDLSFMASKKYNYQRMLSVVDWCGLEIAPITFTNSCGQVVIGWSDYWQQFRDDIDVAYTYGIKTEITIFGGGGGMNNDSTRIPHLDNVLANIVGREHKIVLLEVANESFATGWGYPFGISDVAAKGRYLADRTACPVALSSTNGSDFARTSAQSGSAADVAVDHFPRDLGEGHWAAVRNSYGLGSVGPIPVSSNEPIGAGSSVASENDPIHLCMAGVFAWTANLVSYVYHSRAGVFGWELCCPPGGAERFFSASAGVDSYQNILPFLPKDLASWARNDGKEAASPFTNFCAGQANKWWTEVGGATDGCVRNISSIKAGRFVTCPIGILGGGLTLQARRPMQFKVYNPLAGTIAYNLVKNANDTFTLAQGEQAYVIIGDYTDLPIDPGEGGSLPGTLTVKPAGAITINGSSSDWALGDFVTKTRGGEGTTGDIALVGFDGGSTVYRGAYVQVLPTNAADHTAKVYSRQDATYQYFLVRVDDNQIQTQNGVAMNWANDCVEFYIDPSNDGGSTTMSNSTSDIQLVIDAANQKNVYMCTSGYATQVLAGVTSAVTTDGTGWWLEVRITKTALDPDLPSTGIFGLDFCFRDNDNNNDVALTTIYTWSEGSPVGFPSKIPDHWGDAAIQQTPFGGSARAIPGLIQAEDFDIGGQGVAYNDAEATNFGGLYRPSEGVDITTTADVGGGHIVGWVNAGEWMEYTVNVNQTGDYAIKVRLASANGGGSFHISLDGVIITPTKNCADTGGWDTWTTIIVPGIFMSAGNNKILRFTSNTNIGFNINHMDFAFGGADVVSVDLGNPDGQDGMSHIVCCDGNTIPWTLGGHNARANIADTDNYYYFEVTDGYAFQGNKNNVTITFDYYDNTGSLTLNYDGTSSPYTTGPTVALTGTNTWKTAVWNVSDAYFGNRENGGADFRIAYSGLDFYIDTVMVFATVGGSPPGAASNPSPANGATSVAITGTTLSWTAGSGATNRDVRFGTANPPPFVINQTATTYSPGTLAAGTTYFWRIDEKNAFGTTTGTVWSFTTLPLPGLASAPNPANGATLVAITTDPSWTAGSNATSHDVRFGTVNPPPFVVNQTGTTYAAPTLTPNTVYFWRIDEKNGSGTTTGTVWSFTTLPLPGAASAPNPANAATLVAITADPSWTAGSNAASHDVRFGTVNPPPFVVNQTGTTYAAPTLNPNTVYFWRIDEINSSGTTTGTVWSFTTLPLPGLASAPNPANAATGVSITAALSWTAGSNAASHDVRYGTSNPPPFVQNQAGTSYTPPTKAPNTTYFWRIDEVNSSGTTTGTVWSFTTLPLPGLATAPNPANAATGVSLTPTLTWTAGSNATSHNVRFGTANPPPLIQNQAGTSYAPGTLAGGTVYFWRIDEQNSSGTTTGTVWSFTTVSGPVTFSNSAFPSNADGWNIVVWRSGPYLDGTMAWDSANGNPTGNMLSAGSGATNSTDMCTREGGEINKLISTAGRTTIQVQYDYRMTTDQTGTACSGSGCSLLEGNCADKIAVYYSTAGTGGPWTLLETFNALSVTQNVWATRTINLPAGANNQANFALRIRWQFNTVSDQGRLDNIKVIDLP